MLKNFNYLNDKLEKLQNQYELLRKQNITLINFISNNKNLDKNIENLKINLENNKNEQSINFNSNTDLIFSNSVLNSNNFNELNNNINELNKNFDFKLKNLCNFNEENNVNKYLNQYNNKYNNVMDLQFLTQKNVDLTNKNISPHKSNRYLIPKENNLN
jgi:hypothetical protein